VPINSLIFRSVVVLLAVNVFLVAVDPVSF
jgi:hypothetical protein